MQERQPTSDEVAGMKWWNSLTETQRAYWLREACSAVAADAWAEWKRRHPVEAGKIKS